MIKAAEAVVNHLINNHPVVRVEASLALAELLDHEDVVQLIRPNLGNVLSRFLKTLDEIEVEDMVKALSKIVDVFGEELAPFAIALCQRISQAYIKLLN